MFTFAALIVLCVAVLIAIAVVFAVVLPTLVTDHLAAALSPATAAFSAGAAQVVLLLLLSAVTVALLTMLSVLADRTATLRGAQAAEAGPDESSRSVLWRYGLTISAALIVIPLGFSLIAPMQTLATPPHAAVLAHRGYVAGGVENTIPALEAAAQLGADRVEMDVMQTKDGQFVVIHDFNLSRLAGRDDNVGDLTLDELTQITVHDQSGHTSKIPSLEEYALRARELGMPLLIEVKMGGLDSPDHVDLLVQQLRSLDTLTGNTFHSLDRASVTRLKELLPDTEVGYILPFTGAGIPDSDADFLVLEEFTATTSMGRAIHQAGLGYYVWTVDDALTQRVRLREGVDAMITDRPDTALASRQEMQTETGLSQALLDLLLGFVVLP